MIVRSCKHFIYRVAGPDPGFEKEGSNCALKISHAQRERDYIYIYIIIYIIIILFVDQKKF